MKLEVFQSYSPIYQSSNRCGVRNLLAHTMGFDLKIPLPLGISHGVDFGMTKIPMDIHLPEPLHWAYNDIIYTKAKKIKQAVRMPHPWWFVDRTMKPKLGRGILVIGPPPSEDNDLRLFEIIKNMRSLNSRIDLLIKHRGSNLEKSRAFWSGMGFGVVSAGVQDSQFYERLYDIISSYESIICCTLSSAAFFAAAVGKKIEFLGNYRYKAYDVPNYLSIMNFCDTGTQKLVARFIQGDITEQGVIAREILGYTDDRIELIKSRLIEGLSSVIHPIHNYTLKRRFLARAAIFSGRLSIINESPLAIMKRHLIGAKVIALDTNEISVWVDGIDDNNFSYFEVPYIKGVTEPGCGIS